MEPWIEAAAEEIAGRAERELEALVGVSSPSGDVKGAEEVLAIVSALHAIATERFRTADPRAYDRLPRNGAAASADH